MTQTTGTSTSAHTFTRMDESTAEQWGVIGAETYANRGRVAESVLAMLRSLAQKVLPLRDDTTVLPGHGPATTIGRERVSNPFLLGLSSPARH